MEPAYETASARRPGIGGAPGLGVDPAGQAPAPLPGPVAPHRRKPPGGRAGPTHHPGPLPPRDPPGPSRLGKRELRRRPGLLRTDQPRQQAHTELQHAQPWRRQRGPDGRRGSRGRPGRQRGLGRHPHAHHRQHLRTRYRRSSHSQRSPSKKHQSRRPRPVQLQRRLEDVLRLRLTPLQRATQLATRTSPVANGAVPTFGTPDTYPTILNRW